MEITRPSGLDDALAALSAMPDAELLAGGTDLMVDVNLAHRRPSHVIALRRVPELREISDRWVGAGVTFARLERSPHTALAELARTVGSPQIRAAGTIGGNLGTASPAGDSLPWLAALDAQVVLASATGRRSLRWDEFLLGPKRNARRPGELILGVELPDRLPVRQAFSKIGVRQAMAIATVSCCAARFEDGELRVALGAVGPTVLRVRGAETFLSERLSESARMADDALAGFAELVAGEVRPITDHRSTETYRRHAAGVLARRTVERVT
jgi:CO/xanthine dehydrogenase FAD-binding subunit